MWDFANLSKLCGILVDTKSHIFPLNVGWDTIFDVGRGHVGPRRHMWRQLYLRGIFWVFWASWLGYFIPDKFG